MKNEPIIIIGAGRSGTNILRDTLCRIKGFETWPCDEINYIWRHGNITKRTDLFTEAEAHPSVKRFIIQEFEKFEKHTHANYVVEKTCANTLKVPFIDAIFPKAKYIYIVRNGYDVASSAKLRWTASLNLNYIFKKVKYVPIRDIPYYGFRYFINRFKKLVSKEKRLAYWGPLYPGMMDDLKKYSLIEVSAKQWKICSESAFSALKALPKNRVHFLLYEDFVSQPLNELKKIITFLGMEFEEEQLEKAVGEVSIKSIDNYKKHLTEEAIRKLDNIVQPTMEKVYQTIKNNDGISKNTKKTF